MRRIVTHLKAAGAQLGRAYRKNKLLVSFNGLLVLSLIALTIHYLHLLTDPYERVSMHEEVWTYLFFGVVATIGTVISIQILINQQRKEFRDSQELLAQLTEIVADAHLFGSRLSILYPCPNVGQWDWINRGRGAFGEFERLVRACLSKKLQVDVCMLPGNAADVKTPLGQFIELFHNDTYVDGELLTTHGGQTPLQAYQNSASDFFATLTPSANIKHIDPSWMKHVEAGKMMILAAGHNRGFIGYMTLDGGYRFSAIEVSESAATLHDVFKALTAVYSSPVIET